LFNDLLFCADSLERVPAVAVEGATQKNIRKKKKSQFCPPPGLSVLTIIGITKKMKRRKNARIKKTKKLSVHISMSQTVPIKIYKNKAFWIWFLDHR